MEKRGVKVKECYASLVTGGDLRRPVGLDSSRLPLSSEMECPFLHAILRAPLSCSFMTDSGDVCAQGWGVVKVRVILLILLFFLTPSA